MINALLRRNKGYSCQQVLEVLQSFIDGEVSEEVALAVTAHLDNCKRCPDEVALYRRIQASLATQPIDVDPRIIDKLNTYAASLSGTEGHGRGPEGPGPETATGETSNN